MPGGSIGVVPVVGNRPTAPIGRPGPGNPGFGRLNISQQRLAGQAGTTDERLDAATTIGIVAGDGITGYVSTNASPAPQVLVTNAFGIGVAGVTVTFAVTSGGGSGTGLSQVTDANGFATVGSWTFGASPGANTMTATASGLSGSPLTFHATALSATTGARGARRKRLLAALT